MVIFRVYWRRGVTKKIRALRAILSNKGGNLEALLLKGGGWEALSFIGGYLKSLRDSDGALGASLSNLGCGAYLGFN